MARTTLPPRIATQSDSTRDFGVQRHARPHPAHAWSSSTVARGKSPSPPASPPKGFPPSLQRSVALPIDRLVQRAAAAPRFTGATPANNSVLTAAVVTTAKGATLYKPFEVEAVDLVGGAIYRQYVRGWYKVNNNPFPQNTGSNKKGPKLDAVKWQEDGTKGNGAYGHRDDMDKLSFYYTLGPRGGRNKNAVGSYFYCYDEPGIEADQPSEDRLEFSLEFIGVLTSSDGKVEHARRTWTVRGAARKVGAAWQDV